MPDYRPQTIEKKWQERWHATRAFEVSEDPDKPKDYCLEMFAYPSGHAHVGHVRNYMIGDVVARMKRMRGFNVLHPFGWDAFGLPAENAAIKNGTHPETWTLENIAHMKGQLQRIGISYAWEREIATCLPNYYHWNQWLFLKMLERDLAYKRRSSVNWCPSCNTVLANEQVVNGGCWRCGTPVTVRELEQWFFRITRYADELLEAAERLTDWPEKVLTMQRNWIGKSIGARVRFDLADGGAAPGIDVFTTQNRHDLRRDVPAAGAGAPARPPVEPGARRREVRRIAGPVPGAGSHRAHDRRDREGRLRHRPPRDQSVHQRAGADLGRQFRAGRVRHRGGDGGSGTRRARLRVRPEVSAADQGRGASGRRRRGGARYDDAGRVQRRRARAVGSL